MICYKKYDRNPANNILKLITKSKALKITIDDTLYDLGSKSFIFSLLRVLWYLDQQNYREKRTFHISKFYDILRKQKMPKIESR